MLTKVHKNPQSLYPSFGLLTILILYIVFFVAYGLQQHAAFQTAGFDLGIWNQKIWGILFGHPFLITTQGMTEHSLGDHVDPASLLIIPFYAFFPSPKTFIVIQVIFVTLGAIPVYWLAKDKLYSEVAGLIFAVIYLIFPALEGAILFDFHGITLAVPFLAFALWSMHKQYYRFFLVMTILAMASQEDVPMLTFMLGLYILIIQRNWRVGMITVAISLFWFIVANFLIIPSFSLGGDNIHLSRYRALGNSSTEIVLTVLTRPDIVFQQAFTGDKLLYWIRLTMPTAFIALLDPFTLLIGLPTLLLNTLSVYPPNYQLDRFHSSAPLVPFVVVAGINGATLLTRFAAPKFKHVKPAFFQNTLLLMMLTVTLIYQIQFGHTPIGRYFEWPVVTEHHRKAEMMLLQIPPDAAVAAENNLVPRLSQRQWIFVLPKKSQQGVNAEYIAMDMQGNLSLYRTLENYCTQLDEMLASPDYGLIFADDGLLLFKRGVPDAVTFEPVPPCL